MRSILKPGIALLIFAAIAGGLLGYVNAITEGPIATAEAKTQEEKMNEVLECASWGDKVDVTDNEIINSYTPALSDDGSVIGYAFSITTKGFSSGLNLMVGIDNDSNIQGVAVVSHQETAGLGANAENPEWSGQFKGKQGSLEVGKDIDSITGATITSRAITNAANEVSTYFDTNLKGGVK